MGKQAARDGRRWLAVGVGGFNLSRVSIYRWAGSRWSLVTVVKGNLSPAQWIQVAALTGSSDPDFAIEGCGAGDNNCLSIVSDIGGHWHAVPFAYGYGESLEVNGLPHGHLVITEVDACGCAGGPSTWTYEQFSDGLFAPTAPPGRALACDGWTFGMLAEPVELRSVSFDRVSCADGWAIALGSGAGFAGRVVGLFSHALGHARWTVISVDNGNELPTAPALYDIPLQLLDRLSVPLGSALGPELAAAHLIMRLQKHYRFDWPVQNGLVRTDGSAWLVAVVPATKSSHVHDYPVRALVFRWQHRRWRRVAETGRLPDRFNLAWWGGWFIAAPSPGHSVAFAPLGVTRRAVLTNAGGRWHVAG